MRPSARSSESANVAQGSIHWDDDPPPRRPRAAPTGVYPVGSLALLSRRPCAKCEDNSALHRDGVCITCGASTRIGGQR